MNEIIDTTLREGEQTPGVSFSLTEKKQIIDGLVDIGIDEVELGIASRLIDCPAHLLEYCRNHHPLLRCSLWSRCLEKDIRFGASLLPDIISLSLPVSDLLIRDKLEKDRSSTAEILVDSLKLCSDLGIQAAVGFEDATRADPDFLEMMTRLAVQHGAVRIRLADTIGTASPSEIGRLVKDVAIAAGKCRLAVHCHNDFGMATANAVSALENGADCADATLLGLGERCGCTRLEELAGFLKIRKNRSFNLDKIPKISSFMAKLAGREIAVNQPFIGKEIFTCETGLHLTALHKNPATYEPYPPEMVEGKRNLLIGSKAGRKALLHHLRQHSSTPVDDLDDAAVKSLRKSLRYTTSSSIDLNTLVC